MPIRFARNRRITVMCKRSFCKPIWRKQMLFCTDANSIKLSKKSGASCILSGCSNRAGFFLMLGYRISGNSSAVATPFSPIASAAKAPAVSDSWKARAVPMPCAATPTAKPKVA